MSSEHPQKEPIQQEPVQQPVKGFGVAASPFNGVKFELGIVLITGFVLWLAADIITASLASQLILLLVYGVISASWLVIRTRRILQNNMNNDQNE